MATIRYCALVMLFAALAGRADVVRLKNGDRLSGQWEQIAEGKVAFKTEMLGEVAIPLSNIESLVVSSPGVMSLKGGKAVRGTFSLLPSGNWELYEDHKTRVITATSVDRIYPLERSRDKAVASRNWEGTVNFGYNRVQGAHQTGNFNMGINGTKRGLGRIGGREHWRTNYSSSLLLASTRTSPGHQVRTSSVTTTMRQDYFFTPDGFLFGLSQLEHIPAQTLELRQTYGVGVGRDLQRAERANLSFLTGMTIVNERLQNKARYQDAEAIAGAKINLTFWKNSKMTHVLNFYPSVTMFGHYRLDAASTVSIPLSRRYTFSVNVTKRHLSRPLSGQKMNETVITTGIGFHF